MNRVKPDAACLRCGVTHRRSVNWRTKRTVPCIDEGKHAWPRRPKRQAEDDARAKRNAEIVRLCREDLPTAKIARRFNVSSRLVLRVLDDAGIDDRKRTPSLTEAQMQRARLLASEGLPLTWITEELGRTPRTLPIKGDPRAVKQWQATWPSIRKDPVLLALHREFAPQNSRLAA